MTRPAGAAAEAGFPAVAPRGAAGGDMFCEGSNIFIDFDKVRGRHTSGKPALGQQYLDFDGASTFATCDRTDKVGRWAELGWAREGGCSRP